MKERNSCWKVWRIIVTSFLGACGSFSSFIEEKGTQGGLRPQASNKEARALSSPWSFFFWKEKRRRGLEHLSFLLSFLYMKREEERNIPSIPNPSSSTVYRNRGRCHQLSLFSCFLLTTDDILGSLLFIFIMKRGRRESPAGSAINNKKGGPRPALRAGAHRLLEDDGELAACRLPGALRAPSSVIY